MKKDLERKITFIIAVLVVALAVWFLNYIKINITTQEQEKLVLPPDDIKIKTYSVSGKVDKIKNNKIYYTAPVAYKTDGQTVIKYEAKIAITSNATLYTWSSLSKKGFSYQNIKLSEIKIGDKIVAYFSTLPYDKTEQLVDKIDVPQN